MSCDPAQNGFQFTENYVLGPGGEELTMFSVASGTTTWQRTNVYAAGKLLATYDTTGLHFHLEDPLGTRRMQLSGNLASMGQPETDIQSLPFGDQLNTYPDQYAPATADDATPLHFTGKERDQESGNDYFGARYYASSMGRFMSPDWSAKIEPVPYAKLGDPQSLNLYAYVMNNPMTRFDADGHACGDGAQQACNNWIQGAVKTVQQAVAAAESTMTGAYNSGLAALGAAATSVRKASARLPHGGGIQVGVEAAAGIEGGGHGAGAAATASVAAGIFAGGDQGVNGGVFGTSGVHATGTANGGDPPQTNSPIEPDQPLVAGAGANAGPSGFLTNATSRSDMNGLFSTTSWAASLGIGVGMQISTGKNDAGNTIWMVSAGPVGGFAAYEYGIVTNTIPIYPK
jgi:RHS repeat-associated protein